jgi:hypothetical protein
MLSQYGKLFILIPSITTSIPIICQPQSYFISISKFVDFLVMGNSVGYYKIALGSHASHSLCSFFMQAPPIILLHPPMFFAPARYRVVKIACSYSEVVLRTMNYKAHYDLSWFRLLL